MKFVAQGKVQDELHVESVLLRLSFKQQHIIYDKFMHQIKQSSWLIMSCFSWF